MKLVLPKNLNRKLARALAEFELIEDGDRILIGFSGGKDSAFLVYALAVLQQYVAYDFKLGVATVDLGFEGTDFAPLAGLCEKLGLEFSVISTRIAEYIKNEDRDNPCARCAHFRKGALIDHMTDHGYKKLALGHHYDDVVETFMLSIIYSGQLTTIHPYRFLSDNQVSIIRPLIYLREREIIEGNRRLTDYKPRTAPCPVEGETRRQRLRQRFREVFNDKQLFYNTAAAMREDAHQELWPPEISSQQLRERLNGLWGKSGK
ncbi:MAG: tRNA 2-thiocytidine biosynthesis TtcA family protein [Bacillota bacterium]